MSAVSQCMVVLQRDVVDDAQIIYRDKESPVEMQHVYYMPPWLYDDLGEPEVITFAVVAGDRLNEETSAPVPTPESPRS